MFVRFRLRRDVDVRDVMFRDIFASELTRVFCFFDYLLFVFLVRFSYILVLHIYFAYDI